MQKLFTIAKRILGVFLLILSIPVLLILISFVVIAALACGTCNIQIEKTEKISESSAPTHKGPRLGQ